MQGQDNPIHIKIADWDDSRTYEMVAIHYEYFTALEVGTTFNNPPSLDSYAMSLRGPHSEVFVAWDHSFDRVLGCGALTRFPDGIIGHDRKLISTAGEVRTMHTIPAARGQSIGTELLHHIEQVARDANITRLYIETGGLDGYASARRLYAKAGFRECAVFGKYSEHPDILCMVKEL